MVLKNCRELKTDLIEMSEHHPTCEECAKYQGRVFSLSGSDKRFPKLPEFIYKLGGVHKGCRHSFFPFVYGASKSAYGHINIIEYSNSPFLDNRSDDEKNQWEIEEQNRLELENDRKNYDILLKALPDLAPKSFSGYRKMKKTRSKNYVKLLEKAKSKGINIE